VAVPELRPLAVGEVLDVAIKIVFRHARTLLLVVLFVVVPTQVLVTSIDLSMTEGVVTDIESESVPTVDEVWTFLGGITLIVLLLVLSSTLATGAAYKAVVDGYLGARPDWRTSLSFALRRLHSLVWISVLTYLLASLALVALIVPGVWLFISWSVAVPALLTEDVRGFRALRRSFRLVRGRWWPTFLIILLGFLLAAVVGGIVGGLVGALAFAADSEVADFVVNVLANILGSVITTPFTAAFITVLYVDLRVRKEGFDLQLLAERLGGAPVSTAVPMPAPPPAPRTIVEGDEPPFWPPPPGWKPRSETPEP
jgi:hypothetical protein